MGVWTLSDDKLFPRDRLKRSAGATPLYTYGSDSDWWTLIIPDPTRVGVCVGLSVRCRFNLIAYGSFGMGRIPLSAPAHTLE